MTKKQALKTLEAMPEDEFQTFFTSLPTRTQFIVKSGFVDWKKVLPPWYVSYKIKKTV